MSWSKTPDNYVAGAAGFVSFKFSEREARAVIPYVELACHQAKMRRDHFKDIHEIGEASELQQLKMVEWADKVRMWSDLLERLKALN